MFNRDGSVRWQGAISDRTSNSTGSTVFDLDGDGSVEVIYRDEANLRIYRGADGLLLSKISMGSSTWSEMPVVADVDNDGHADLVVTTDRFILNNLTHTGLYVLQDVANKWVRTRRVWNQHSYHVTNVNEDGSVPEQETPHWLLPGLNSFRLNTLVPETNDDNTDTFQYVASDGQLQSTVATVRIAVRKPNSAPRITSTGVVNAAGGVLYTYAVRASDPDFGDILTFSLPTAPAGMTIDAPSGLIHWTPTAAQLGAQDVVVKVQDVRGQFALQGYAVQVGTAVAVPHVVGQLQGAAAATVAAANLTVGAISTRNSPTVPTDAVVSQSPDAGTLVAPGTAVDLVVSVGPPPAGTVPDVVGQQQASAQVDIVAAGFAVGAIDRPFNASVPAGLVISQNPPGGSQADTGSPINLVVSAGVPPADRDQDHDGFTGGQGDCDDTDSSIHPGASDAPGDGVDQNCNGRDSIGGDATPPSARISSPDDLATVTMPTDVLGTATDTNFLRYTLSIAEVDSTSFTTLATGASAVSSGVLGRLDPTLLENGLYRVRLIVEDIDGQVSADERVYRVDGQAKVGAFRLSFTDLSVPVAGIPITLVRTYDSRLKTPEDFGIGWTLDIKRGSYRHNRTPGQGWIIRDLPFAGSFLPCIGGALETRSHVTEVRLSDRESYTFALTVTNATLGITGACEGVAAFRFLGGTRSGATLDILDPTAVIYLRGGEDTVLDLNAFLGGDTQAYDPRRVRLTTADGRTFELDRTSGITRIRDLNGNALSITPAGIVHSTGRTVAFVRDSLGRITRITDPNGRSLSYEYDAAGDLTTFRDQANQQTTFTYDGKHNVVEIIDAVGRRPLRTEYDDSGRVVVMIDADGNRTAISHNVEARQEVTTDRLGNTSISEYDERGNIVRRIDPLRNSTTSTFDGRDNLLSETNALGHTRHYTYDDRDNRLTETDALGNTTTFTYDGRNRVLTMTDARGATIARSYDSSGNLATETGALGTVSTNTYDSRGNRLTTTNAQGHRWTHQYDAAGNRVQSTDPRGNVISRSFDSSGNQLVEQTRRGTQTVTRTYEYDARNQVTREIDSEGGITRFSRTATLRLQSRTDPSGHATRYTYDEQDRLIRSEYPDGTSETIGYDAEDRVISWIDRAERVTTFGYDPVGRQTFTRYPDGTSVEFSYDTAGRMVRRTDENGRETSYAYDDAGRISAVTDSLNRTGSFGYDTAGNLISRTDRNGNTTAFTYDLAGQRTRTTNPDGTVIQAGYDDLRHQSSATDQLGNTTRFQFDSAGNLIAVTDALNAQTRYGYDALNHRVNQTDARGGVTQFTYDRLGRLLSTTLPLGQVETRTYDAAGRLRQRTDFNGQIITLDYDSMNRLVRRVLAGGEVQSYSYTPTGKVAAVTDRTGTTTFAYDRRDRPSKVTYPDAREIAYEYDRAGNRTTLSAPNWVTTYSYDAANRLSRIVDPLGHETSFAYDAQGNRTRIAYANGIEATYSYDTLNRLTAIAQIRNGTTIRSYNYILNAVGNRQRSVEDTGRTVDYTYDAVLRLTEERIVPAGGGNATTTAYSYDAAGNRTSRTGTSGLTLYTYDANNRLLTAGTSAFAYDGNGNLAFQTVAGATTAYQYDGLDRLVRAISPGGATTDYQYDGLGNRVSKVNGGGQTRFLVDPFGFAGTRLAIEQSACCEAPPGVTLPRGIPVPAGEIGLAQVLVDTDGSGTPLAEYVYDGEGPIGQRHANSFSFYLPDAQRSIRLLSDEAGAVTDRYDYDAFGSLVAQSGLTSNPYLYDAQRRDSETGLYYLRARYYDPPLGRFTSVDPFAGNLLDPFTLHPYIYARNDPVNLSDPTGEFIYAAGASLSLSIASFIPALVGQLKHLALHLADLKHAHKVAVEVIGPAQRLTEAVLFANIDYQGLPDELLFKTVRAAQLAMAVGYGSLSIILDIPDLGISGAFLTDTVLRRLASVVEQQQSDLAALALYPWPQTLFWAMETAAESWRNYCSVPLSSPGTFCTP